MALGLLTFYMFVVENLDNIEEQHKEIKNCS